MILTNQLTCLPNDRAGYGAGRLPTRLEKRACIALASISQPLIYLWAATTGRFDDLSEAFTHLQASTRDKSQVRLIYGSLLAKAFLDRKSGMIGWLLTEIRFEAFAASTKDRAWAALMDLKQGESVAKEDRLALYQERLGRAF